VSPGVVRGAIHVCARAFADAVIASAAATIAIPSRLADMGL